MKYTVFGKSGIKVSRVAFGGIPIMRLSSSEAEAVVRGVIDLGVNFIDTAFGYGDSEEKIGKAVRDIPREELIIASKSPAGDKKSFNEQLEESLRRLGTDYIDFYQHHNIGDNEKYKKIMGPGGAHEGMLAAVQAGKVRFPAFSSHSLELSESILRNDDFYAVQLPFNFVDNGAADKLIPLAKEKQAGFIAMKPLGGGMLDDAELCFRYLNQFDSIVPDPGIERLDEMKQIIGIIDRRSPLTDEEQKRIEAVRSKMKGVWCHRCQYCMPCPQEIKITPVLSAGSMIKRMPKDRIFAQLDEAIKKSSDCTGCRECVERCPYDLDIPVLLEQQREYWEVYSRTGAWPV